MDEKNLPSEEGDWHAAVGCPWEKNVFILGLPSSLTRRCRVTFPRHLAEALECTLRQFVCLATWQGLHNTMVRLAERFNAEGEDLDSAWRRALLMVRMIQQTADELGGSCTWQALQQPGKDPVVFILSPLHVWMAFECATILLEDMEFTGEETELDGWAIDWNDVRHRAEKVRRALAPQVADLGGETAPCACLVDWKTTEEMAGPYPP
ncbi:MAG: hypothetical protein PHV34_23765 [Verrucomicrobiae bacterium]|nr:hypothetical protein [Verrucomicrobiae bacterium]